MDGTAVANGALGAGWLIVAGSILTAVAGLYVGISLLAHVAVEDFYIGPSRFTEDYTRLSQGLTYASAVGAILALAALVAAFRQQGNAAVIISATGIGLILLSAAVSWLTTPATSDVRIVNLGAGELAVPWEFRPRHINDRGQNRLAFRYPHKTEGTCRETVPMSLSHIGGRPVPATATQDGSVRWLDVGPYAVQWNETMVPSCLKIDEGDLARTVASWSR